ncbi:hypothetical protein FACI_IFERC00001G0597 [Ferroplasma acidarmanus Fer1]|uniref:Uncharacterized protein n=1 Tax=Ferroplasma acidarmanus Fer1 TaxID=333146 RepID=S0AP80_FERAC|nr:hypothetical protein FACI_IFERC00001G0597 [Ferroplasma acidarmanus Fer1]
MDIICSDKLLCESPNFQIHGVHDEKHFESYTAVALFTYVNLESVFRTFNNFVFLILILVSSLLYNDFNCISIMVMMSEYGEISLAFIHNNWYVFLFSYSSTGTSLTNTRSWRKCCSLTCKGNSRKHNGCYRVTICG